MGYTFNSDSKPTFVIQQMVLESRVSYFENVMQINHDHNHVAAAKQRKRQPEESASHPSLPRRDAIGLQMLIRGAVMKQSNLEIYRREGRPNTQMFRAKATPNTSAWVLLFELQAYNNLL